MCDEDTQTLRRFTLGFDRFSAVPINRNLLGCFAVESPLFANNWRTTLYVHLYVLVCVVGFRTKEEQNRKLLRTTFY